MQICRFNMLVQNISKVNAVGVLAMIMYLFSASERKSLMFLPYAFVFQLIMNI